MTMLIRIVPMTDLLFTSVGEDIRLLEESGKVDFKRGQTSGIRIFELLVACVLTSSCPVLNYSTPQMNTTSLFNVGHAWPAPHCYMITA